MVSVGLSLIQRRYAVSLTVYIDFCFVSFFSKNHTLCDTVFVSMSEEKSSRNSLSINADKFSKILVHKALH